MKIKVSTNVVVALVVVLLIAGYGIYSYRGGEKGQEETPVQTQQEAQQGEGDVVTIEVVAKQWEFVPREIRVKKGQRVRIRLSSPDVAHGMSIPALGINQIVQGGETVEFEFVADRAGRFEFFCSVPCGVGHSSMRGVLIVEE